MAMEKIGVEAVMPTMSFDEGMKRYKEGLNEGQLKTLEFSQKVGNALLGAGQSALQLGATLTAGLAVGIAALGAGALAAVTGIGALVAEDTKLQNVERTFNAMGGSMDRLVAASHGLFLQDDLMQRYVESSSKVSQQFAETLPQAMEYAYRIAEATGTDMKTVTDAYSDSVERLSTRGLKNMGIIIAQEDVAKRAAEMYGVAAEATNEWQQQSALSALALEAMKKRAEELPAPLDTTAQVVTRMKTSFGELTDFLAGEFRGGIYDIVSNFEKVFKQVEPQLKVFISGAAAIFESIIPLAKEVLGGLLNVFGINLGGLADDTGSWGENVVLNFAQGMANAIGAVVSVLQGIGQTIASWLMPGSPPKLLPDLDKWGAEAATIYMQGWGEADFSMFDALGGALESFVKALPEEMLGKGEVAPALDAMRMSLVQMITEMGNGADVGATLNATMDSLLATYKWLPDNVRSYALALVSVDAATRDTEEAQAALDAVMAKPKDVPIRQAEDLAQAEDDLKRKTEDLTRAQSDLERAQDGLTRATLAYDAALAPLNAQMDALSKRKRLLQDQMRMEELTKKIADEKTSENEKALAQIEIEEIKLRQNIDTTKEQAQVGVDAAKAGVNSAKSAVEGAKKAETAAKKEVDARKELFDLEQKRLDDLRQAEVDTAKARVDASKAVETQAKRQLSVQKSLLDQQTKANASLKEQTDIVDKLDKALSKLGAAGAGAKAPVVKSTMEMPKAELPDVKAGLLDPLTTTIEEMKGKITGMFDPLKNQIRDLGWVWEELMIVIKNKWDTTFGGIKDWIDAHGDEIKAALVGIGVAIGIALVPSLIAAGAAAWTAATGFLAMVAPFALIAAVVGLLYLAWTKDFGGIRTTVTKFWEETLKPFVEDVGQWFSETIPKVIETVKKAWADLSAKTQQIIGALSTWWNKTWSDVRGAAIAVWNFLTVEIPRIANDLVSKIKQYVSDLVDDWEAQWDAIQQKAVDIWESIKTTISTAISTVYNTVTGKVKELWADWVEKWGKMVSWLTGEGGLVEGAGKVIAKVLDLKTKVIGYIADLWTDWREKWDLIIGKVRDVIGVIWGEGSFGEKVQKLIALLIGENGLGAAMTWIKDHIIAPFQAAWEELKKALQPVVDLIRDAINLWNQWTGRQQPPADVTPPGGSMQGGYGGGVTAPAPVNFGSALAPSPMAFAGAGGTTVTLSIGPVAINNGMDMATFEARVAQVVRSTIRRY